MREQKGNSLLLFPNDYTVIDIETTGLSPEYDEIIEICALKYRNKTLIDKFCSLVKPTSPVDVILKYNYKKQRKRSNVKTWRKRNNIKR